MSEFYHPAFPTELQTFENFIEWANYNSSIMSSTVYDARLAYNMAKTMHLKGLDKGKETACEPSPPSPPSS